MSADLSGLGPRASGLGPRASGELSLLAGFCRRPIEAEESRLFWSRRHVASVKGHHFQRTDSRDRRRTAQLGADAPTPDLRVSKTLFQPASETGTAPVCSCLQHMCRDFSEVNS